MRQDQGWHLRVGGNSGACFANEQVSKLKVELLTYGRDRQFARGGVEVLISQQD